MNKNFIKGNFRKTIFKSDKGYIIGLFKIRETSDESLVDFVNKTVTFTGYFHELNPDDLYVFYGDMVNNERYGTQYQVKEYERVKPEGRDGIIEFLSSDLFPGVGGKTAESIVETLGDRTLELILDNVNNLQLVPKLKDSKAQKIYDILTKYNESHKTIVYLSELGFSMQDSLIIYNTYKGDTISNIEYNIYKIAEDIIDINFEKIDSVARKMNIELNDERRAKAALVYVVKKLMFNQGDTYLFHDEILDVTLSLLENNLTYEELYGYLTEVTEEDKLIISNDKYYLPSMYNAEQFISQRVNSLNDFKGSKISKVSEYIAQLEKNDGIIYNDEQKEAITEAIEKNLVIITGGPGTGKTTIIKAITKLYQLIHKYDYEDLCQKISLLAPTGRAAKRMSNATGLPASTIHRFLKWNKDNNEFQVNEMNMDFSEFIILDEVSMIDTNLFSSLLKGLTRGVKIVIVGDFNQLPSVGEGQVLKDMIDSDIINTVKLKNLYRQEEDSYIIDLAYSINSNDLSENFTDKRSDYNFITCNNHQIMENTVISVTKAIEKGYSEKELQLLAPMYKGEAGIDNMNIAMQKIFNPKQLGKKEYRYGELIYREGDKVIQLVNNPDENVYNGDIGFIKYIKNSHETESKKNEIYIDFEGNIVRYLPKDINNFRHGYCISIHKAQGSEFDIVIMPISPSFRRMLYRKILYTGVTRAKNSLLLIGDVNAFQYGVRNNYDTVRKTGLKELLVSVSEK